MKSESNQSFKNEIENLELYIEFLSTQSLYTQASNRLNPSPYPPFIKSRIRDKVPPPEQPVPNPNPEPEPIPPIPTPPEPGTPEPERPVPTQPQPGYPPSPEVPNPQIPEVPLPPNRPEIR